MNKTIYIKPEDAPIWEKAKRYLRFYSNESLADAITPHLASIVAEYEADESRRGELGTIDSVASKLDRRGKSKHTRAELEKINDIAAHPERYGE